MQTSANRAGAAGVVNEERKDAEKPIDLTIGASRVNRGKDHGLSERRTGQRGVTLQKGAR